MKVCHGIYEIKLHHKQLCSKIHVEVTKEERMTGAVRDGYARQYALWESRLVIL